MPPDLGRSSSGPWRAAAFQAGSQLVTGMASGGVAARRAMGEACRHSTWTLGGLIDDALDLAAVDVEFAGDGSLAVAGVVPGPYALLQARRLG